jgi:hypothetical protein
LLRLSFANFWGEVFIDKRESLKLGQTFLLLDRLQKAGRIIWLGFSGIRRIGMKLAASPALCLVGESRKAQLRWSFDFSLAEFNRSIAIARDL